LGKYKKGLINLIKIGVGALAFWLIISMVGERAGRDWPAFLRLLKGSSWYGFLLIVALMSVLNLFLESEKWKFLVGKVEVISIGKSLKSVLAGWNLALFTPARLGEFGGRILFLLPENRKKGALCLLVGNLSQLLVTFVLGLLGTLFWIRTYLKLGQSVLLILSILIIIGIILFIGVYFSLNRSHGLWSRIPFLKSQLPSLEVLRDFSSKELWVSLVFSLGRYILFTHQYVFLLFGFMGAHPYFPTLYSMSLIFLVQSIVPSFILSDMGIRGANAVFFLSFIFGNQNLIPILATAFYVWLVNIILPALIGLFFVLKVKSSFVRT